MTRANLIYFETKFLYPSTRENDIIGSEALYYFYQKMCEKLSMDKKEASYNLIASRDEFNSFLKSKNYRFKHYKSYKYWIYIKVRKISGDFYITPIVNNCKTKKHSKNEM